MNGARRESGRYKENAVEYRTWSDEWKRTEPDIVVYLPEEECGFDSMNQQLLVTRSNDGSWLAFWTRGADEGEVNQSIVMSRSTDRGSTWSEPIIIDGPRRAQDQAVRAPLQRDGEWLAAAVSTEEDRRHAGIASWGFPIVAPDLGRIYCFYTKNEGVAEYRYDLCGVLRGRYSDDNGITWSDQTFDLPIRRTVMDHPDPRFPINWIVFQTPYVTVRGEVIAPFTRWPSRMVPQPRGAECWFLRFDNILTESDPARLKTTTLPDGEHGLRVPTHDNPSASFAEEPAIVELSDGRLFCEMRTAVGYIACSISEDRGHTWSTPAPLYRDADGELMLNPVSPSPIYKLKDGRYILLYYSNKGDAHGGFFPCEYQCYQTNRYPAFISVGYENPQGKRLGVEGLTDAATYPSLLEDGEDRILFYPDRKHFLLGRRITDEWLAE